MKDAGEYMKRLAHIFSKYKYVMLVAAIGLVLLVWPFGDKAEETAPEAEEELADAGETESRIRELLEKASGVGRAEVMLTLAGDIEYEYTEEYTRAYDKNGEESSLEEENRYISVRGSDGEEKLALRRRVFPEYRGAVVICDGADNAGVRLRVINAVSALTGLSSDCITVMKMK